MDAVDAADRGLQVRLDQNTPIPLQVALQCRAGQALALVGPSGSGKSTVLRSIAGLHGSAQGEVSCGGEVWLDSARGVRWPVQRRRVGMVFQHYGLFPHLSALANVAEAVPRTSSDRRARATALLQRVNLQGLEDRKPHQLSGGQQQRVAVARALAREPAVLLLDEPFSAVDQVTRHLLHDELAQLRARLEMPVVLVTHDLNEAALLADRMAILSNGRILQEGAPVEVLQRPASAAVARMVGMRNIFKAQVERHDPQDDATWLRWDDQAVRAPLALAHAPGSWVSWAIPGEQILLPPRDGLPNLAGDVPFNARVVSVIALGQSLRIVVQPVGRPQHTMIMTAPPANAARHGVEPGREIPLRLRSASICVMPAEDNTSP